MGGGIFNVHHAVQSITHTASNVGHKALELANPVTYMPPPAEGRSRGDQMRTITRKFGSTVKETGNAVEKAGDVVQQGSKYVGYAATAGEVVGMGLTAVGMPEFGVPLAAASAEAGELAMAGQLGGNALHNAGAWRQSRPLTVAATS